MGLARLTRVLMDKIRLSMYLYYRASARSSVHEHQMVDYSFWCFAATDLQLIPHPRGEVVPYLVGKRNPAGLRAGVGEANPEAALLQSDSGSTGLASLDPRVRAASIPRTTPVRYANSTSRALVLATVSAREIWLIARPLVTMPRTNGCAVGYSHMCAWLC